MLNRRKFLALSAAAWPAMALGAGKHTPLGVQLYTIRNLIKDDNLLSLLKQIRAIGYEEVELFPEFVAQGFQQSGDTIGYVLVFGI